VRRPRGFTLMELLVAIFAISWIGFSIWVVTLIVRALLKYING